MNHTKSPSHTERNHAALSPSGISAGLLLAAVLSLSPESQAQNGTATVADMTGRGGSFECAYDPPEIDPYQAPLYWSVYEYHFTREQEGIHDNYISEVDLLSNIIWVEENLLPYGYAMIAMDGWGDLDHLNEHGYRMSHSRHWANDYDWWACHLRSRGMHLAMYDNPLWVHMNAVDAGATVVGTDIPLANIIDPDEGSRWFTWVQVDRAGAEEYVKGNVRHWADMGIRFLNVDFLSWFEDGYDKNMGNVGPDRPREHYETAMRWMFEAAEENDMLLKAVMPHLNDEAEAELRYSHMFRINEDTGTGGWERFSEDDRGNRRPWWSQWANPMDGYAYWSQVTGRDDVTLCGDFVRLNTFDSDNQRRSVISQHLMAGGPIGAADQHNTIGDHLWLYQNEEMLALNYDGFTGQPLNHDPNGPDSQIWTGQMSNGDWVVALFNRENSTRTRSIDFAADLSGFPETKNGAVRDLWLQRDLGVFDSFAVGVPPRGVRVLRIETTDEPVGAGLPPYPQLWILGDAVPAGWNIGNPDEMAQDEDDPWIFTYAANFSVGEFKISTFTGDWCDAADWIRPPSMHPPLSQIDYIVTTGCPPDEEDYKWLITEPGFYRLILNLREGTVEVATATGTDDRGAGVPAESRPKTLRLHQNYPNPFNPSTVIGFELPVGSDVKLEVYDMVGRRVATLVDGFLQAGSHEVTFHVSELSSGAYLYRIEADDLNRIRRMAVVN